MAANPEGRTLVGARADSLRRRLAQSVLAVLLIASTAIYTVAAYVGWQLTHPQRRLPDSTPAAVGLSYESIEFSSRQDGILLKGWLIKGDGNKRTVIVAHGYGRNRLQDDVPLLPIVRSLADDGANVVMFDFRHSGESAGTITSVGLYETGDLLGAVDFAGSRPDISQHIVLYGFSMGASTAIIAAARELRVAAVIADAPFADLSGYLADNLSVWSGLPRIPFNHAILTVLPLLTGIEPAGVSPLREVSGLGGRPLLLIHGEADADIPPTDSMALQNSYSNSQLLLVANAVHVGSFRASPESYLQTVTDFLHVAHWHPGTDAIP